MRARSAARFLPLVLGLCACTDTDRPVTLEIAGDTLIYAARFGLPDGSENANCGYRVRARLAGDEADTATITQGRVTYSFVDSNQTHLTWEWTPERLPTIWKQPTLAGGDTATSEHHDISFSLPFRAVRGEVTFDYTLARDTAVHRTSPFNFTCY
jgi:hypothetical protein